MLGFESEIDRYSSRPANYICRVCGMEVPVGAQAALWMLEHTDNCLGPVVIDSETPGDRGVYIPNPREDVLADFP